MQDLTREEKRVTRYICLQILYSVEISDNYKINSLLDNFFKGNDSLFENIKKVQIDYIKKLYKVTVENKKHVDDIIENKLNNWDINRVAAIDKAILRMSISEMLFIEEVPPKVY